MVTFDQLKPLAMEEQYGSQGWAQASRAWADAARAWEAAVYKTPTLSDVRARWTSAATSWASAAHAWTPGSEGTSLNGNLAWLYGSRHWAGAALRWAMASLNWAANAEGYPACAPESVPSAVSALDWASAAEAWAKPQSSLEAPPLQWTTVATIFAVDAERTADLCAWVSAGRGFPPLNNHPWSIEETENRIHGRREDVEAAPVAKVSPHPPSPANLLIAVAEGAKATQESMDSAGENQAAREEDTAHSVAADEQPVSPPQDQAGADATGTSVNTSLAEPAAEKAPKASENKGDEVLDLKNAKVPVDCAATEKAHKASENKGGEASENKGGEGEASENKGGKASENKGGEASENMDGEVLGLKKGDTAWGNMAGKFQATTEKARKSSTEENKPVLPDLGDRQAYPDIQQADPKKTRPPKPKR